MTEQPKVENIIIRTNKLYLFVKLLKGEIDLIPKDTEDNKLRIKRFKLRSQHEILNSILNNLSIDKVLDKFEERGRKRQLAEAIEKDGGDQTCQE